MKSMAKMFTAAVAFLAAVTVADYAAAQPVLGITMAPAKGGAKLTVTSPDFKAGAALDDKFTQNGENKSPAISWTKGPAGTQAYVLLTEDAGGNGPNPIIHWVIYDIPAAAMGLPQGVATDAKPANGNGATNGMNQRKASGFMGPKPPAGMTHPYHFEVFALDTKLNLDPAMADRMAVVNAMKDHVLASGEIVVNYTGK